MSAQLEVATGADAGAAGGIAAPILEAKGLHAAYGETRVLHGIDFAVREGGVSALLGANGAGKTTTLRAICGMVKTQGEIRFAGERIDGRATEDMARRGVAHVPDGRGTFMELTVEENLRLGAYTRRDRAAWRRTSSACSATFRGCANASASRRARCPAASSRCWRSRGRWCCGRSCCCWTSRRSAWRR